MTSESMLAQRRAVAPPGRRLRALMSLGSIPVSPTRSMALHRRPCLIQAGLMEERWPLLS